MASEEVGLPKRMSLCYEVQGQVNQTFNLISDTCVSVNALYSPTTSEGTSISKIGVLAKDNGGRCQEIEVDLAECEVRVNGQVVKSTYKQDGVDVRHRGKSKVRIAVPNCKDVIVMVMICRPRSSVMPFEVSKGTGLGNTSHGLVGMCSTHHTSGLSVHVTVKKALTHCCVPLCVQVSSGMRMWWLRGTV